MRGFFLRLCLGLALLGLLPLGSAWAQTPVAPCVTIQVIGGTSACVPVSAANPLPVTGGGGGGGNAAAGATGAAPPSSASYTGFMGAGGNLTGVSATNPFPDNVVQFGGAAVQTGTGNSGAGVPRVTVSSDSFSAAGLATSANQITTYTPVAPGTATATQAQIGACLGSNGATFTAGQQGAVTCDLLGRLYVNDGVAQGSTTSTQVGPLVQGAVVTGNPTLTSSTTAPVSLTTTGQLRVAGYNSAGTAFATAATAGGALATTGVAQVFAGMYFTAPLALTNNQSAPPALNQTGALFSDTENLKASYSVSGLFALAATPTDVLVLPASSTKTDRLKRLRIYCSATTAGQMTLSLIRRGVADSGGTTAAPNPIPHNTVLGAATSVPVTYTANPTTLGNPGALGGPIDTALVDCGVNAAGPIYDETFGTENAGALVLSAGSAQNIAVNLNGSTLPTGVVMSYRMEWTEE